MENRFRINPWNAPPVPVDQSLLDEVIRSVEVLGRDRPQITDVEVVSRLAPKIRDVIQKRVDESHKWLFSVYRQGPREDNELVRLSDCTKMIAPVSSLKPNIEIENSILINAADPLLGPIYTSTTTLHEAVYRRRADSALGETSEDYRDFLSNYLRITLDDSISADYAAAFFENDYGRRILGAARLPLSDARVTLDQEGPAGSTKRNLQDIFRSWKLGEDDIARVPILRPNSAQQSLYVSLDQKVRQLQRQLTDFQTVLPIDSRRTGGLHTHIESLLAALAPVSDQERVQRFCQQEESLTLEFKESYRVCGETKQVKKELRTNALKEIVGMINSRGGTLLIGIHDKTHQPTELFDFEINTVGKGKDIFLNQFGMDIERSIGKSWVDFYQTRFVEYMGKPVLIVEVQPHPPDDFAFLDDEPYVRQSEARTIKMGAKEWQEYTRRSSSADE